jgi:hypothetical protein
MIDLERMSNEEAREAARMINGHLKAPRVGGKLQPRIKQELAADLAWLERALADRSSMEGNHGLWDRTPQK